MGGYQQKCSSNTSARNIHQRHIIKMHIHYSLLEMGGSEMKDCARYFFFFSYCIIFVYNIGTLKKKNYILLYLKATSQPASQSTNQLASQHSMYDYHHRLVVRTYISSSSDSSNSNRKSTKYTHTHTQTTLSIIK